MSVRFGRTPAGSFSLDLGHEEQEALKWLCSQLRELLLSESSHEGDPAVDRLFPPAYSAGDDDAARKNLEYAQLMRDDLLAGRLGALEIVEGSLASPELTEEEMLAWMGALNDLRLVLGTRLDVTEDLEEIEESDPRAPMFGLYQYLTWLQSEIIDALSAG